MQLSKLEVIFTTGLLQSLQCLGFREAAEGQSYAVTSGLYMGINAIIKLEITWMDGGIRLDLSIGGASRRRF